MNICYSLERNFVTNVPKLDNYFQKQNWNFNASVNRNKRYIFSIFSFLMKVSKSSRSQNPSVRGFNIPRHAFL